MFIDTHCHLDAAEFDNAADRLISEAFSAGVSAIVLPSVERGNFARVKSICDEHTQCAAAYGIHPLYTDQAIQDDLLFLSEIIQYNQHIAIGEIGLDFYIHNYNQKNQEYFFAAQLKLAHDNDLPVLLHIRKAHDTVLKHLRQQKVRGGIAHAFNGSTQQAEEFIKLGFKLGFGGAMTYPRATKLRELARTLPLDSIVLETDAPDMPPAFLERGQPNKPAYLPLIAQTLAELRGVSLEEIAHITTENALAALPGLKQKIYP